MLFCNRPRKARHDRADLQSFSRCRHDNLPRCSVHLHASGPLCGSASAAVVRVLSGGNVSTWSLNPAKSGRAYTSCWTFTASDSGSTFASQMMNGYSARGPATGTATISVDTKKKELVGPFKEWRSSLAPRQDAPARARARLRHSGPDWNYTIHPSAPHSDTTATS
jgi:hypothetical protein